MNVEASRRGPVCGMGPNSRGAIRPSIPHRPGMCHGSRFGPAPDPKRDCHPNVSHFGFASSYSVCPARTNLRTAPDMSRSRRSPKYARLTQLLTDARLAAGLTQVELAARLRRPQSYVSKYEAGERRLDVIEFLEVADRIGCSPESIMAALIAVEA